MVTVVPRALLPAISAMVFAMSLGACEGGGGDGSREATSTPADAGKAGGGQLFVITAAASSVQAGKKPHRFDLTLKDAGDSVAVFTDRPERKAGTETVAAFVDAWVSRGFDETPPNAAVVWAEDGKSTIFELSEPAFDVEANSLTFAAEDLGDRASTALSNFEPTSSRESDAELPQRSGEASVFIDNAPSDSDVTGDFWGMSGPAGATATITFDTHTVIGFRTVNARGEGSGGSSARELKLTCIAKPCWIFAEFTLSPGALPITGDLKLAGGAKVDHPAMDGNTQIHKALPAGPFSVTPIE